MAVCPTLKRGESSAKENGSPVGTAQTSVLGRLRFVVSHPNRNRRGQDGAPGRGALTFNFSLLSTRSCAGGATVVSPALQRGESRAE